MVGWREDPEATEDGREAGETLVRQEDARLDRPTCSLSENGYP